MTSPTHNSHKADASKLGDGITVVLATGNKGKVKEFTDMLSPLGWRLLSLKDIGFSGDIEESGKTFLANALIKAQAIARHLPMGQSYFILSDDSGLEVNALGGAPGVHTARFAGPNATNEENRIKLLNELKQARVAGQSDRSARFVCVLCLFANNGSAPRFYEGFCSGTIAATEAGDGGFGYDPLFIPQGEQKTFAELPEELKHQLSHRGQAVSAMIADLKV